MKIKSHNDGKVAVKSIKQEKELNLKSRPRRSRSRHKSKHQQQRRHQEQSNHVGEHIKPPAVDVLHDDAPGADRKPEGFGRGHPDIAGPLHPELPDANGPAAILLQRDASGGVREGRSAIVVRSAVRFTGARGPVPGQRLSPDTAQV